jgi:hypothetical protein
MWGEGDENKQVLQSIFATFDGLDVRGLSSLIITGFHLMLGKILNFIGLQFLCLQNVTSQTRNISSIF